LTGGKTRDSVVRKEENCTRQAWCGKAREAREGGINQAEVVGLRGTPTDIAQPFFESSKLLTFEM
jgi:hypothetical protein